MSSNTSKGRAEKGSKFWMQMVVNTLLKEKFDEAIGNKLTWISPLKGEKAEYLEYELRHKEISEELFGLTKEESEKFYDFWPYRQPQWDGIAVSEDGSTLYLVEAKAHTKEMDSKMSATSPESKAKIINSMEEIFMKHYLKGSFSAWKEEYYQLGNRLTFLHKLQEKGLKFKNVKLILLNFVDDYTYRPTSIEEWHEHCEKVFKRMTGDKNPPEDVIVINFSVAVKGVVQNPMSGDLMFSERYSNE